MNFKELKATLSKMSWQERISHIWFHYKYVLLLVIAAVIVVCGIISSASNKKIEVLYSGAVVNVNLSDTSEQYLHENWMKKLNGQEETQKVELLQISFQDLLTTKDPEKDSASAMHVTAMVAAQSLDYVIMDEIGYHQYKDQDIFASVEEALPEELQAKLESSFVYHTYDGVEFPIAIDISDLPFIKNNAKDSGKVYIAFPGNTGRTERNAEFVNYLLNWE